MRIGIFSAKGGVGKTTFSINFASALIEFGKNPLLIDTDLNNSLSISLGLLNFTSSLSKVLNFETNVNNSIYITPSSLKVLPAGEEFLNFKNFELALNEINNFDYIIIDTEPGLNEKNLEIARLCNENFLITLPETTSIYALMRTINFFEKENIKISGVIVNRFNKRSIDPKEIFDVTGIPILAVLPEEQKISKSLMNGIPYVFLEPFSNYSLEIKNFASTFLGIPYKKPKFLFLRKWLGLV